MKHMKCLKMSIRSSVFVPNAEWILLAGPRLKTKAPTQAKVMQKPPCVEKATNQMGLHC